MRKILMAALIVISISASAQTTGLLNGPGGQFSLGVRTTASFFNDKSGTGTGYGGQFRLRFMKYVNSDWFFDYIQSDVKGLGKRTDYHIGWAIIFYPPFMFHDFQLHKLQPYFLAGHCFDYTKFTSNYSEFYSSSFKNSEGVAEDHRWSAAISAGLGFHYPVAEKMDISMNALYMYHFAYDIQTEVKTALGSNQQYLFFENESQRAGLEGHLLVSFSLNYRICDLWKKHIKMRTQSKEMEDQNKPNQF